MTFTPLQQFIEDLSAAFVAGDRRVEQKAAEATNVEQLQALYQNVVDGDLNAFIAGLDADVEFENVGPEDLPFINSANGPEEVGKALAYNLSILENQEPVVNMVVAQGDTVVVFASEDGTFRESGSRYSMQWVQQFTFKNRKLTNFRQVLDSASFMQAAGVMT